MAHTKNANDRRIGFLDNQFKPVSKTSFSPNMQMKKNLSCTKYPGDILHIVTIFKVINVILYSTGLTKNGDGRVVRWCWINFQYLGVLLMRIRVGQGPTALALGVGGGCLDIFLSSIISSTLSPSLWERFRLKYCHKGPLSPKQPTSQY